MNKKTVIIALSLIIIAIILGAFGAHGLKKYVSADKIDSFEVGVRYQMYHGLALFFIGMNFYNVSFSLKSVIRIILLGTLLFSCSIYLLSIQEIIGFSLKFLGPVTPIGGAFLISGWILFLIKVIKSKS